METLINTLLVTILISKITQLNLIRVAVITHQWALAIIKNWITRLQSIRHQLIVITILTWGRVRQQWMQEHLKSSIKILKCPRKSLTRMMRQQILIVITVKANLTLIRVNPIILILNLQESMTVMSPRLLQSHKCICRRVSLILKKTCKERSIPTKAYLEKQIKTVIVPLIWSSSSTSQITQIIIMLISIPSREVLIHLNMIIILISSQLLIVISPSM